MSVHFAASGAFMMSGDVTVPAFVIRGLSKFTDPTDFTSVKYKSEADLRDALATIWWLHGMVVRVEVDVPKCGRIDVLGQIGNVQMLVELKREIRTPSQARKALVQASTYKAFLEHQDFEERLTGGSRRDPMMVAAFVTCADAEWSTLRDLTSVFQNVESSDFTTIASEPIASYWTRDLLPFLREIAQARAGAVADLASALRVADRNLCTELEVQKGIAA